MEALDILNDLCPWEWDEPGGFAPGSSLQVFSGRFPLHLPPAATEIPWALGVTRHLASGTFKYHCREGGGRTIPFRVLDLMFLGSPLP